MEPGTFRVVRWLQHKTGRKFFDYYYSLIFALARFEPRLSCFNYGYAHLADQGTYEDAPEKYQLEMYRQVALAAGPQRIEDACLLEISSGLGGGLAFLARSFSPRLALGLERAMPAVIASRRRFEIAVIEGDARDLRLPDNAFDVIINIEASHAYFGPVFLSEVARVLRSGGIFAIADSRPMPVDDMKRYMNEHLEPVGLVMTSFRDITANVALSNERDDLRREEILKRLPRFLRGFPRALLGGVTTENYRLLKAGVKTYFIATFEKRPQS